MAKAKIIKSKGEEIEQEVEDASSDKSEFDDDEMNGSIDSNNDGYDDETEDDIVAEDLEENISKKRKLKEGEEDLPRKKQAKGKKKNVKPPTAEEMLVLRETENLFQSNLFRLQIDEILAELKPKKSVKRYIGPWIENLKNVLLNLSEGDSYDLSDMSWLSKLNISLPVGTKINLEDGKGVFCFKPPVEVLPIGSHAIGCPLGPVYTVDIALVMPKNFILHNDNLNQRYHIKRALYLCYIAEQLKNCELLSPDKETQFTFMLDDPRKPLLLLHPSGRLSRCITVRLYPIPNDNSFIFKRFLPTKNNCRSSWWGLDEDITPPTPMYNASVLEDMVLKQNHHFKKEIFDQNQSLKDAFVLLRVWLKQRELSQGFGSFNSHILSMLLIYLYKISKINKFMSSYQIIRHVWLYLGDSDWTENGPSLCETKVEDAPSIEDFHTYYDIVFVDISGYYNIAACLNKWIYLRVKKESNLAMQHLDNREIDGFRALFMGRMPFIQQFDSVISFGDYTTISRVVAEKGDGVSVMDYTGYVIPEFIRIVTELLEKGISHRLLGIAVGTSSAGAWNISSTIPTFSRLYIGLKLNPSTALSLIDKGPQSNEPEAEEFREFWGDKCDLRRFKDGTVCESVAWEEAGSTINKRRSITDTIIIFLLKQKLNIRAKAGSFTIISKAFERSTESRFNIFHSREETCKKVHFAYEELSRQLRDLPDLPLSIVSVHCISPVYRFSEPFPPVKPYYHRNIAPLVDDPIKGRLFGEAGNYIGQYPPEYIAPIDCVVQMAVTTKWPNDVNAGKRLIAAFNIAITSALKKHCNLSSQVTTDYFVVNKDGYLFRLCLGYSKEIGLLKLKISEERQGEKVYRDTPESLALEMKFINLPKITGAIYRLSEEFPGFSPTVCLAKRWFASQLLDNSHFPEVVIEVMVAHIFITPQPYTPSLAVLPAFLRFLTFISTTDWSITPVIVNFNSILSSDEIKNIEKAFRSDRSTFAPLALITPYDRTGSLWTKSVPTIQTLVRLAKIAGVSLHIIENNIFDRSKSDNIMKVFRPPLSVYDAVIKLKESFQFRKEERFFHSHYSMLKRYTHDKNPVFPILGFNPVDLYLSDLRENYRDFALFFHDPYGGLEIGVLLKPKYLEDIKFQSSATQARKPYQGKNKEIILKPHIDSLLEGFKILGSGIVKTIELKKLNEKSFKSLVCT